MQHGQFAIDVIFHEDRLTPQGADQIEFRVSTNPGQPLQALARVASGGNCHV